VETGAIEEDSAAGENAVNLYYFCAECYISTVVKIFIKIRDLFPLLAPQALLGVFFNFIGFQMQDRFFLTFAVIILSLPFINSAQSFNQTRDSLLVIKNNLLSEQLYLQIKIDSLKKTSDELDEKISSTLEEISNIYKKKFGKEKANRILNKQVWKGMTDKMLAASWGKPDKIDKNVEKWGVFTQWYYGDVTFFFKNGKLTDWEEIKK
jgi:hypothetical protein